ncbi:hypothetical protein HPP92_025798 [Vanilla planifolia]|uniref:Uncharacterized protein n=1 Tax=Vanilla planifolia TaxID=51239 RepID=A0A835PJW8_VANPL|nr:hypothetical protein HPP92_025798 [Vanilla planifolia]
MLQALDDGESFRREIMGSGEGRRRGDFGRSRTARRSARFEPFSIRFVKKMNQRLIRQVSRCGSTPRDEMRGNSLLFFLKKQSIAAYNSIEASSRNNQKIF